MLVFDSRLQTLDSRLKTPDLKPDVLDGRVLLAVPTHLTIVIPCGLKFHEGNDRHTIDMIGRGGEPNDRAAADDGRPEFFAHQRDRFQQRITGARDVINNDARIDLTLIDILAKHTPAIFALGPVDLFGV